MKLTTAIAQYLYVHKRLDIAGIGSFILDPSALVNLEAENSKNQKNPVVEGVSFENNPSVKESPELVAFISSQTGKMKALAAADLSSHVELMQQFLNIGKPFMLEGIGSLVKMKSGEFVFTPGTLVTEKLKDIPSKSETGEVADKSFSSTYEPFLHKEKAKTAWRKPVAVLLVLAGIGFAVWGGYTLYKKNEAKADEPVAQQPATVQKTADTIPPANTAAVTAPPALNNQPAPTPAGNYKFVLETSGTKRAFERFSKLKVFQWPVQMETKDSLEYTLYMLLPASASDTTRLLDSLTRLNGKRVIIGR